MSISGQRFFVLSVVAAALTACAVDQKREVATYRDVLDQHVPATQPYAPRATLTLAHALELANANNEQLGLSGEQYVQSLIDKNRAVAAFLPTVSLLPSYSSRLDSSPGGAIRNSSSNERIQVPVVGAMNIFRGFGDVATLHAAEATIAQRRDLLLDLQQTVLLNVAQVYYQVLRSERQVDVLINSLKLQEARAADMKDRANHGLATALEVAQSRAEADATGAQLVQAQNDVATARSLLANLIAVPQADGPLTDEYPVPDAPPDPAEIEKLAVTQRQDLLAAQTAVAGARQSVDAAIAEYYPSVSLNLAAFLRPETYASPAKWNAVLIANVPIFTAGIVQADIRDAWSRWRQALLLESQTRRQVHTDVQIACENVASNRQRLARLQSQVQAAVDAYQQAKAAYEHGLAINLDVLTAQDQMLQAQLDLASATFDRTVFYLDLIRASGELIVRPPVTAPVPATAPAIAK